MPSSTLEAFHTQDEELRGVDLLPEDRAKILGELAGIALLEKLYAQSDDNIIRGTE